MKTIQVRRTRHAGHCWRNRDELISDVLLWTPTYGREKAGRPARTYIQQLFEDTRCSPEDLPEAMNDREKWRERVRDIRACGTTWWWWWWWYILYGNLCKTGPKYLIKCVSSAIFDSFSIYVTILSPHTPMTIKEKETQSRNPWCTHTHTHTHTHIYIYIYIVGMWRDSKLHLMVRLQSWSFEKCGVRFHCHCS